MRDTPPRLAPLGNYGGQTFTRALLSGSPAINAGRSAISGTPDNDQRRVGRFGNTDIGAFEVNASFVAVLISGSVNSPYNQIITPNNGTATYTLASGTLPPGLSLTTNFAPAAVVAIQGTPTMAGTYNFAIQTTDGGNTNVTNYQIVIFAPTAASVSVGGRVLIGKGTGLRNAVVQLTDMNGVTRSAITGAFGYYSFDNISVGATYFVSVRSKRYQFEPQVLFVSEDVGDLNFIASP